MFHRTEGLRKHHTRPRNRYIDLMFFTLVTHVPDVLIFVHVVILRINKVDVYTEYIGAEILRLLNFKKFCESK